MQPILRNALLLLRVIFEIGSSRSYEVIDYRITLRNPLLASVEDKEGELMSYLRKLHVDYPKEDLHNVTGSYLFGTWQDEFHHVKEGASKGDSACELSKTRVNSTTFEYHDAVSEFGQTVCYEQCVLENEEFFKWFLMGKMQRLIWKNRLIDLVLEAPRNYTGEKNLSECTRLAEKKYRCDCFYRNYVVKVSREFDRLFDKVVREVHEAKQNLTREELEKKYGLSMKVVGFLVVYHLSPHDMFPYITWWADSEPGRIWADSVPDDDSTEYLTREKSDES